MAYQVGTFAITDMKAPVKGKFVEVLPRQEDDTWKVSVVIFNSDMP